jgi:hypothetical protein
MGRLSERAKQIPAFAVAELARQAKSDKGEHGLGCLRLIHGITEEYASDAQFLCNSECERCAGLYRRSRLTP